METYHAVPFIKTCRHELLRYPYQCSPDLLLTNTPKGLASEKRHLELETETLFLINWDRDANCIDRLLSLILFLFGGKYTCLSITQESRAGKCSCVLPKHHDTEGPRRELPFPLRHSEDGEAALSTHSACESVLAWT